MRAPRDRFKSLFATAAASMALVGQPAIGAAAEPSTEQCLQASDTTLMAESAHKLRTARTALITCASASCPLEIRKECARRIDAMNDQIPTIIFEAKDAAGVERLDVTITMDGEPLAERIDGSALEVDPGEHTFTFTSANYKTERRSLLILQSQKNRHEVVTLALATPAASPVAEAPVPLPASEPHAAPVSPTLQPIAPIPPSTHRTLGGQKIAALVVGGVGVLGLAAGAIVGGIAMSQRSTAEGICPGAACPTAAGSSDWKTAYHTGNVATVALIAGGVLAAGGATLWLTAPTAGAEKSPSIGFGLGSVALRGSF